MKQFQKSLIVGLLASCSMVSAAEAKPSWCPSSFTMELREVFENERYNLKATHPAAGVLTQVLMLPVPPRSFQPLAAMEAAVVADAKATVDRIMKNLSRTCGNIRVSYTEDSSKDIATMAKAAFAKSLNLAPVETNQENSSADNVLPSYSDKQQLNKDAAAREEAKADSDKQQLNKDAAAREKAKADQEKWDAEQAAEEKRQAAEAEAARKVADAKAKADAEAKAKREAEEKAAQEAALKKAKAEKEAKEAAERQAILDAEKKATEQRQAEEAAARDAARKAAALSKEERAKLATDAAYAYWYEDKCMPSNVEYQFKIRVLGRGPYKIELVLETAKTSLAKITELTSRNMRILDANVQEKINEITNKCPDARVTRLPNRAW